jgi:zinc and cadmium transporter
MVVRTLVGLATGALLGAAFLHLIPESLASGAPARQILALVLGGFFVFFLLERYIWRHQHDSGASPARLPPLATVNIVGDGLHNALDGMAIASAFLTDGTLGTVTALAVILHEVPQEMGDFGVLLHSGLTVRGAARWNLISAMLAFLGALAVLLIGTYVTDAAVMLVPVAAGGFIYVAASDLIPAMKGRNSLEATGGVLVAVASGVIISVLPLVLLGA